MITDTDAAATILLLDCCFSGAFKGQELEKKFQGAGRFMIAASQASQTAPDAGAKGQMSPFTQKIVGALRSGTTGVDPEVIYLGDVYDVLHASVADGDPQPVINFKGSGKVPIGRKGSAADVADRPPSAELASQTISTIEPRAIHATPELFSGRLPRIRAVGDLSLSDLRSWWAFCAGGVAVFAFSILAFLQWSQLSLGSYPDYQYVDSPKRLISVFSGAWGAVLFLLSIFEGHRIRGLLKGDFTKKAALEILNGKAGSRLRLTRDILGVGGLVFLLLAAIGGFQSYTPGWIVTITLTTGIALASIIRFLLYGDAFYLSAALLSLASYFLPGESRFDSESLLVTFHAILALLMVVAWWLKAVPVALLLAALFPTLMACADLAAGKSSVQITVSIAAGVVAIATVLMGAGVGISDTRIHFLSGVNLRHREEA